MLIVGVTGGMGSGKTTVSGVLREEGACIIDADQIARELLRPGTSAWKEVVETFGKEILASDGSVRRKKLATIIFSNPHDRSRLNQVLHPRIKRQIAHRLREIGEKNPDAIVVVDAALLVETDLYREMDRLIVVTATESQQLERIRNRDGLDEGLARRILKSQMPTEEKTKVADHVVSTEGTVEETRERVREIFRELKRSALQKKSSSRWSIDE